MCDFFIDSPLLFYGDLKLPVLFNTESSQRGVTNVWIFCINSGLPFNTGSQYSSYCFIRRGSRFPASFIVGSLFKNNFEGLLLPLKEH